MELRMMLDGKLIDTIKMSVHYQRDGDYLDWLKRGLKWKHQSKINKSEKALSFYIYVASND